VWAVTRTEDISDTDDGTDNSQSDADSEDQADDAEGPPKRKIDRGDDPDVQYWCGYCGRGPFIRESQIEGHHDREDHPGEPVPRTSDPANVLEDYTDDAPIIDDERSPSERVRDWLDEHLPETQWFKTEDVAIESATQPTTRLSRPKR